MFDARDDDPVRAHARYAGIKKTGQSVRRVADATQNECFPGKSTQRGVLRFDDLHVFIEKLSLSKVKSLLCDMFGNRWRD